ncbi:glycoside hydrolase family 98 domain-containing protein, partial [Flavobacterium flavipallidum]
MKKELQFYLAIIAFLIYGQTALAQEVIYDFNSATPLVGVASASGTVEAVSVAGLTDNSDANTTTVLRPKTVGSPNQTGVANLTSFPSGSDYSVTWKEYITTANTSFKKGFLLRASGTGGYTTGIKQGYFFMVQNNATTGSVNFRILNSSSATSISNLKDSGAIIIAGFAVNKACWFRASVTGNVLKFEYSMDGVTFTVGTTYTDTSNLYTSGSTQLVYGIGSGTMGYLYDDIKFKSTIIGNSTITVTGASSYDYNGAPQGPNAATVSGSTGVVTYTYTGTGSTSYGPSSKRPVMAGTYSVVASVAADSNYYAAVSSPFSFTINSNPSLPIASMRRVLSPTSPMYLIHVDAWTDQPQEVIDLIPMDIRPFVVINISMSTSILGDRGFDCAESWLNTCAQNGMWAMVQASSGIQNAFATDTNLSAYESLYIKYPNFIGYNFCEQSWGFDSSTFPQRLNLFTNLLEMGHKYGGYLYVNDCFSISNAGFNTISKFKASADFANATKVYKANMIYGNKFTNSYGYYDNESGALGAFLSGHAANYAIRYDMYSWGWSGKGQIFGAEAPERNPDGNRSLFACPEAVMGVPIVEQMMVTGATVIDGPEVPWMSTFYSHYKLPAFDNMIADILRKVKDGTIRIPTVNEVAARTKVVFVNDVDANTTNTLFSGLYAMDATDGTDGMLINNRTWFKKSGRYATIPQLYSDSADEISLFSLGTVFVKKSQYQTLWSTEAQKVTQFNSLYPEVSTGDMYVSRLNNSLYAYNPWLNTNTPTSATIPLKYNTCTSVQLSYEPHTFSVINESANKIQIYLNNYRTDKNHLWTDYPDDFSWYRLQTTILPQYATNPPDGTFRTSVIKVNGSTSQPVYTLTDRGSHKASTASVSWANGIYTLTVVHNGPVDISIDCSGIATDRATAPAAVAVVSPMSPIAYTGEKQYEAEGAIVTSPASVNSTPLPIAYHGTGFVRFSSTTSSNSSVKFKVVNVEVAGSYDLDIRYAALANVNLVDIFVNGTKISTPTFPATGSESTYAIFNQKINLNQGTNNTIELKANTAGAIINIDKIILTKTVLPFSFVSVDAVQKNSSQIQVSWNVADERNLLRYEVLKSTDGINYTSISNVNAVNNGSNNNYVYLDNTTQAVTNYYKIKAIDNNAVETLSAVAQVNIKTAIPFQAELGVLGSDWDALTASEVVYVTSKTDAINSNYPGDPSKVISYTVTFEKPGTYDLYAKVWIGAGGASDDSFYYGKLFGSLNSLADANEWVMSNNLGGVGYAVQTDIVGTAGTVGSGQWKWINLSKYNGGETPVSFNVVDGAFTQTFQIGGRENGIQIDKFVFGSGTESFTVKEL